MLISNKSFVDKIKI
jgi:hypothetical protein